MSMEPSDWTIERALPIGITMEEGSIKLYTDSQGKVTSPGSKRLLRELAEEEKRHRRVFVEALNDPENLVELGGPEGEIADLKVTDSLMDSSLSPDAGYQDILIFAAKSEKKAHDFYIGLAKRFKGHPLGRT